MRHIHRQLLLIGIVVPFTAACLSSARNIQPAQVRAYSQQLILDNAEGAAAYASVGDLDSDGDLDVVLAKGRHAPSADLILINDGKGRFRSKPLGTTPDRTYSAILADVDADNDLDILVSNQSPDRGVVYLNDGRAEFTAHGNWGEPGWNMRDALPVDLNGDRLMDIVVAIRGTKNPSGGCLNDGRGNFSKCVTFPVESASNVATADFDRDGNADLAFPHRDGGQSTICYGNGAPGCREVVPFGHDMAATRAVVAADFNRDDWPDLIVGDERVGTLMYMNDGAGRLTSSLQVLLPPGPTPYSLESRDLNNDGTLDLIIGYYNRPSSVLLNDGTGRQFSHSQFGDGKGAVYGFATGDLDGDSFPDIVAARSGAPSTAYFSRPGGKGVSVATTDKYRSSIEFPDPVAEDSRVPVIGLWDGVLKVRDAHKFGVRVAITGLEAGKDAGRFVLHASGIPYCTGRVVHSERKSSGAYVLIPDNCKSEEDRVEVRLLPDGALRWEQWYDRTTPQDPPIAGNLTRIPAKRD